MKHNYRSYSKAVAASQKACSHIAGALGDRPDEAVRTGIVWHEPDDRIGGSATGICMECLRIFRAEDPDYARWRARRSFNGASSGGHEATEWTEQDSENIANGYGNYTADELWAQHFKQESLDINSLPTEVINILYEEALRKRKASR